MDFKLERIPHLTASISKLLESYSRLIGCIWNFKLNPRGILTMAVVTTTTHHHGSCLQLPPFSITRSSTRNLSAAAATRLRSFGSYKFNPNSQFSLFFLLIWCDFSPPFFSDLPFLALAFSSRLEPSQLTPDLVALIGNSFRYALRRGQDRILLFIVGFELRGLGVVLWHLRPWLRRVPWLGGSGSTRWRRPSMPLILRSLFALRRGIWRWSAFGTTLPRMCIFSELMFKREFWWFFCCFLIFFSVVLLFGS